VNHIHDRIQDIARDVFDNYDLVLTDSTTASDVEGWDSLAHVAFMYSVEEEFGVHFSDAEFAGFTDIGDLKRTLQEKVSA